MRNQLRYRLAKRDQLIKFLSPIPKYKPTWRLILEVLLPIRKCLQDIQQSSESTQVIEIRNIMISLEDKLKKLELRPVTFQNSLQEYLTEFRKWLLILAKKLAQGDFPL